MNRRKFFNTAASFVLGCALGLHCKLKDDADEWILNPAWEQARYELCFIYQDGSIGPVAPTEPRFNLKNGKFNCVPKFVSQTNRPT